jgi:NADH-quinone oxidoreductase subunit M
VDGQAGLLRRRHLKDINLREFSILALLAAAVLYMGVNPKPFTDVMHASVSELARHVAKSKDTTVRP